MAAYAPGGVAESHTDSRQSKRGAPSMPCSRIGTDLSTPDVSRWETRAVYGASPFLPVSKCTARYMCAEGTHGAEGYRMPNRLGENQNTVVVNPRTAKPQEIPKHSIQAEHVEQQRHLNGSRVTGFVNVTEQLKQSAFQERSFLPTRPVTCPERPGLTVIIPYRQPESLSTNANESKKRSWSPSTVEDSTLAARKRDTEHLRHNEGTSRIKRLTQQPEIRGLVAEYRRCPTERQESYLKRIIKTKSMRAELWPYDTRVSESEIKHAFRNLPFESRSQIYPYAFDSKGQLYAEYEQLDTESDGDTDGGPSECNSPVISIEADGITAIDSPLLVRTDAPAIETRLPFDADADADADARGFSLISKEEFDATVRRRTAKYVDQTKHEPHAALIAKTQVRRTEDLKRLGLQKEHEVSTAIGRPRVNNMQGKSPAEAKIPENDASDGFIAQNISCTCSNLDQKLARGDCLNPEYFSFPNLTTNEFRENLVQIAKCEGHNESLIHWCISKVIENGWC